MKADKIRLFSFNTPQMRAFHMTWIAFFLCFFGWFGLAPLMPLVRADLHLTKEQVATSVIASVAGTIFARLLVGYLCDKYGPRRVYAGLLALGALPIMGVGLVHDYTSFLVCRVLIGLVGASFVITQYHTSAMFAPSVVGTANATTAGWGNLGGGVTQMVMPLVVVALVGYGLTEGQSWRYAMIVPGGLMLVMSVLYLRFTQDSPEGKDAKAHTGKSKGSLLEAARDPRVWALFVGYGACFGVELTIHNIAASYFHDRFALGLKEAGMLAGSFGVLAIFARSLGGYLGDRAGRRFGLSGRGRFLTAMLLLEGVGLIAFSRMNAVVPAAITLVLFGLFVHIAAGATYSVVPFIKPNGVGAVAGIVGAGGNVGAVLAGLLFRNSAQTTQTGLLWLGGAVMAAAALAATIRFGREEAAPSVEAAPLPAE
ncbi:MAG: major facilitator superfamily transporter [Polyangiaceae bacterium]|nr:major facilitator superfamily transporter [Polyangiaceae bacterium]